MAHSNNGGGPVSSSSLSLWRVKRLSPASRWLVAVLLGLMFATCRQRDAPRVSIMPGKPNLVVLFKAGTAIKSQNRFLAEDVFELGSVNKQA